MNKRISAILCHVSSLPGPGAVGDLGEAAHQLLRCLQRAGQGAWQVLPLGPTGYGDSPYQLFSAMAGNPLFINLEKLSVEGLLAPEELEDAPPSLALADYGWAQQHRFPRLFRAYQRLLTQGGPLREEFAGFCAREAGWLDDYALYMSLKEAYQWAPWHRWPAPLRDRRPEALREAAGRLGERVGYHRFTQWQFERQWQAVHAHARHLGVEIIGDVPIFVAHDSVEVWQEPGQFLLHGDGALRVQAGVPPDYFSATGQLWGNPLYDWERMKADGFAFWRRRVRRALGLFDRVRIDHFRGFCAHWEIPGTAQTAVAGRWVHVDGAALFAALAEELGGAEQLARRFIAEDLGVITADVEALRDQLGLPGMRVLQFSFGDGDEDKLRPYALERNVVLYTSTHDNDTLMSWFRGDDVALEGRPAAQAARERRNLLDYLGMAEPPREGAHWPLLRLALSTVAQTVILPVQDLLGLGTEARMNFPGRAANNWRFRLLPGQLEQGDGAALEGLRQLCRTYGRGV